MSWKDPDSPWAKAMHKKRRANEPLPLFVILLALIGIIVICTTIAICGAILRAGFFVLIPFIGGLVLLLFIARATARGNAMRKNGPLINLISQNNGLVCPHCREILIQPDNQCPHCKTNYNPVLLKTYWQQRAFDINTASQFLTQASDKTFKQIRPNAKFPIRPLRPREKYGDLLALTIYGTVIFILLILYALYPANIFIKIFTQQIPIVALAMGLPLLKNYHYRLNDSLRFCAQCEYQQTPDQSQPDNCPECGNSWLEDGHSVLGTKIDSPWKFWLGIVLVTYGLIYLILLIAPLINTI